MKKIIILFLSIPILFHGQTSFFKSIGGAGNDIGQNVISTKDGGFCIVGATESFGNGLTDLYIIKTDVNGQVEWHRTFGGPNIDFGNDIVETNDSSFIACGYSNSINLDYQIFVVKVDKNGNLIWANRYGDEDWDFSNAIVCSKHDPNHFLIAGESYNNSAGNSDGIVLKIDSNGNVIWTKTYGGINKDFFNSIQEGDNGNIYCLGTNESVYSEPRLWITKLDTIGDSLWNYYNQNSNSFGQSITLINQKIIFAGGKKVVDQNNIFMSNEFLAGSVLKSGVFDFNVSYPYHSTYEYSSCIDVIKKPNSNQYYLIANYADGVQDNLIFYADLLNQTQQVSRIKGNGNEYAHGADTLNNMSGIVITGTTEETNLGFYDVFLAKTDDINWSTNYVNDQLLNVEEINKVNFSVYPNPTHSQITVMTDANITQLYIFNQNGNLVKTSNLKSKCINVEELVSGQYFISPSLTTKDRNTISFIKL